MAAAAACKRVGGINIGRFISGSQLQQQQQYQYHHHPSISVCLHRNYRVDHRRDISQLVASNGKRLFLVDTLALVI